MKDAGPNVCSTPPPLPRRKVTTLVSRPPPTLPCSDTANGFTACCACYNCTAALFVICPPQTSPARVICIVPFATLGHSSLFRFAVPPFAPDHPNHAVVVVTRPTYPQPSRIPPSPPHQLTPQNVYTDTRLSANPTAPPPRKKKNTNKHTKNTRIGIANVFVLSIVHSLPYLPA